jgi:hypothetical protein
MSFDLQNGFAMLQARAAMRPPPPFSYHKVLRDLLDVNGSSDYTEVIVTALDIGWTDQFGDLTEYGILTCIQDPQINENLLRVHRLVVKYLAENVVISDDDEDWLKAGMDFPSPLSFAWRS